MRTAETRLRGVEKCCNGGLREERCEAVNRSREWSVNAMVLRWARAETCSSVGVVRNASVRAVTAVSQGPQEVFVVRVLRLSLHRWR